MRQLFSFVATSLDGFHVDAAGAFDWPNVDEEFHHYSTRQLNDVDTLLFGRVTYEHMAAFWPTAEAEAALPVTTGRMRALRKLVVSSTLTEVTWENSELVATDPVPVVRELLARPGEGDVAVFGSSTLTAGLLEAGVVDELRVMVNPILLGGGTSLFTGLTGRAPLRLARTTSFRNGNVLLTYTPGAP